MAFQDFDLIQERVNADRKRKFRKKITIGVVSTLVVVAVITGGAFAYVTYGKKSQEPVKTTTTNSKSKSSDKSSEKSTATPSNKPPSSAAAHSDKPGQNQLTLWKYPSMVKMAELTGHTSRVLYMAQSPDGCTVASAAGDETLRFWNVFGVPETAKKAAPKAAHEPFSHQMEEQFKALVVLSHYLETGRFQQFWDEAAKNRHFLESVPGFELAIQAYASHLLSLSYQKVPRSVLAEAVNMDGASLDKFIEQQVANSGWIAEKEDGNIVLPQNEFNHPELKKNAGENVPLEHIARIFPILG
ncbi:hypothetical protein F2Q70_00033441 [Brassica cretica]|uniref:CSN8/PSMD8/EIF3K domain-containing protein n=1 Tax=Brassica cretica TaxID=69181 RepID=A0A8S9FEQ7_BRACR|nr:hypothetical protein F2Q70_00033441 [Brassica cretica]